MNKLNITKKTKAQVLKEIRSREEWSKLYESMPPNFQRELLLCGMGEQGIRITYDSVFKKIFNPKEHPKRLEHLISALLGEEVTILEVLSDKGLQIKEHSSFVIMDVVVRLKSGGIVHVDMQKVGYAFPANRTACYSADLLMRQYNELKKKKKKKFTFEDIKEVYSIVIMENSTKIFREYPDHYIHHGTMQYDTGIKLNYPCKNVYINLDNYRKCNHTKIRSEQDAWLTFLSSVELKDIFRLCEAHPKFYELYEEMFDYCKDVEGLMNMFSEALAILSKNEEELVVQLWKEEAEEERALRIEAEKRLEEGVAKARAEAREEARAEARAEVAEAERKANARIIELERQIEQLKKEKSK